MRKQPLHPRTAVINQKQKIESKTARREALTWLTTTFPQIFDNQVRIRPLKLGIMEDLLQHAELANQAGISKSKLRQAVVLFTRRLDYLACLKAREMRVDLAGNPVEPVSEEDAERAAAKIKKRIEKNIKNYRKTSTAPAPKVSGNKPMYSNQPVANPSEFALSSTQRPPIVTIRQKTTRQYDPSAVARLKEKLGLARPVLEEVD